MPAAAEVEAAQPSGGAAVAVRQRAAVAMAPPSVAEVAEVPRLAGAAVAVPLPAAVAEARVLPLAQWEAAATGARPAALAVSLQPKAAVAEALALPLAQREAAATGALPAALAVSLRPKAAVAAARLRALAGLRVEPPKASWPRPARPSAWRWPPGPEPEHPVSAGRVPARLPRPAVSERQRFRERSEQPVPEAPFPIAEALIPVAGGASFALGLAAFGGLPAAAGGAGGAPLAPGTGSAFAFGKPCGPGGGVFGAVAAFGVTLAGCGALGAALIPLGAPGVAAAPGAPSTPGFTTGLIEALGGTGSLPCWIRVAFCATAGGKVGVAPPGAGAAATGGGGPHWRWAERSPPARALAPAAPAAAD